MTGYILFLAGIDDINNGPRCTAVAALIQYFFLATWCWMCVYSYDLYLSLVKVSWLLFEISNMMHTLHSFIRN